MDCFFLMFYSFFLISTILKVENPLSIIFIQFYVFLHHIDYKIILIFLSYFFPIILLYSIIKYIYPIIGEK